MSAPVIPPRPARNPEQTPHTTAKPDAPLVPPRPIRNLDASPERSSRSPLNFPPTAASNRPPPKRKSEDLPRRPPSVALPDVGHEGEEYSSFDQLPDAARAASVDDKSVDDKSAEQTRYAANLPMHQPKASVPQSTATRNISKVTDTDSSTAAAAGIGKSKPADDVHKQPPGNANMRRAASTEPPQILRAKASFNRSSSSLQPLEYPSSRPGSVHGDDSEHGIPEIGMQIPLNRWAGDAQAPTPGGGQTAHTPGIGFFNDGASKSHKKRHSRQDFGPPDSYGIRHDHDHADQFEKEWIKKHPQEAAKEEFYQHLPKPETALSDEQLNRLVHQSDNSVAAALGTPDENEAFDEYLSRIPTADQKKASSGNEHSASASRLHPDHAVEDVHGRRLSRYDSEDEYTHYDGTPILAADELVKRPSSAFMHAAVEPEPHADDEYYDSDNGRASHRTSMHVSSRPSSRPGSVQGTPNLGAYGGGALHRYTSHEDTHHSGLGTPLEEIEEYEPLFPEDEGAEKGKVPKAIKKRPDLAAMHHFPSQDVWEDTPASLQYSAEVSTPDLERRQEDLEADKAASTATFETPEQEELRKQQGPNMLSDEKTFLKPHFKPGVADEVRDHSRPAAHRFPSADIWEDTPSSMLGETTVSTPDMDDAKSFPDDRATTSALPGQQDDDGARATTGLSSGLKPVIPSRPQRTSKLTEETSPTKTKAPSIPAKPSIPVRPARSSRSEGEGNEERVASPPLPKAKPAVPGRPGSKISALQAGFMNDLNNRLKLGPQAPPKKEEEEAKEEVQREPLVDARKSRAKGPPRRKPATSPASARKSSTTFAMSPLITCWTIDESDELLVKNDSEKENAEPEAGASSTPGQDAVKSAEKALEQNAESNVDAAAPADEIAAAISRSRNPSATADEHLTSAAELKAALAEAGAGPAIVAAAAVIQEGEESSTVARKDVVETSTAHAGEEDVVGDAAIVSDAMDELSAS